MLIDKYSLTIHNFLKSTFIDINDFRFKIKKLLKIFF